MHGAKDFDLVSFRMDRRIWREFLKLCRSRDTTASNAVRNYIKLCVSEKVLIKDLLFPLDHKPTHPGDQYS